MNFSGALVAMRGGDKITRPDRMEAGGTWIALARYTVSEPDGDPIEPYIYEGFPSGDRRFWIPSQGEILAEDWEVVPE